MEGNGDPGHKRSDDGPYTRPGQQTGRADRGDAVIDPTALPNRSFFADAAVTNTQTLLKILKITSIKWRLIEMAEAPSTNIRFELLRLRNR